MENKFKIGTKVKGYKGIGTIICNKNNYLVEHDEYNKQLHNGENRCKDGYGWYYSESEIELLNEEPIYSIY